MIRSIVLWAAFVVMFVSAVWMLELLEGSKVTTTEYYGLRNLGGSFLYYIFLIAAIGYPITVMPLSFVLNRMVRYAPLRTVLYTGLGAFLGWRIFLMLYQQFEEQYELWAGSALIIFGMLGLLYGILDLVTARQESHSNWT